MAFEKTLTEMYQSNYLYIDHEHQGDKPQDVCSEDGFIVALISCTLFTKKFKKLLQSVFECTGT